jgi:pimeloyl-ACP methyl ester carboxylesterase
LLRYPLKAKRDKTTPVIQTPTLIVWGEGDAVLGKELTYATGKYVEDLQIRYLAGVSHWVQQEAPEVTNAMIEAFLNNAPVPYAKWQMNLVSEEEAGIS